MRRLLFVINLLAIGSVVQAQQFVISTAAGAKPPAMTPVEAVTTSIAQPKSITTDAAGNVYFAVFDPTLGRNGEYVLKLDQNGLLLTRIAGGPREGFAGDGGPAINALFDGVGGVAVDGSGDLYITDSFNSRVRKVSPSGIITTIAGNGTPGYSGDGGAATNASLNNPSSLAIDAAGNLYFVEGAGFQTNRIRKVSSDGIISTMAGTGVAGYSGDGGPAVSAQIGFVSGLTMDGSGNLYFSDVFVRHVDVGGDDAESPQPRVRKISPDGIIITVAGNGTAGYSGDGGPATAAQFLGLGSLAVDRSGNLYIAETANQYSFWAQRIRKVSADGIITTLAGNGTTGYSGDGGPATSAQIKGSGLGVDGSGNLYIADGPACTGSENCQVQFDGFGNPYLPGGSGRIRRVSSAGTITTVAGNGFSYACCLLPHDGLATQQPLFTPLGVAVDNSGTLDIADAYLRRVSPDGIMTSIITGPTVPAGAAGMVTDPAGNLYFAEYISNRIRELSPTGVITTVAGSGGRASYSGDGGPATSALLNWPKDVALDGSGNLYIADSGNSRIRMVSPEGIITTVAGTGEVGYSGDGGSATNAELGYPAGVAVDSGGNLYVADTNNFRVRKISTTGIITTIAGSGVQGYSGDGGPATRAQLNSPTNLKIDSAGNLYIADGAVVRMVSPAGIITTVAGNGIPGYSGDGGPSTSAQLSTWALALDRNGKVYVTDPLYNTVRLLTPVQ